MIATIFLRLEKAGLVLSCLCCAAIALLSFIDITLRNLKIDFFLANEGNGFLMGWMIFLVLPFVSRSNSHIVVDFAVKALWPGVQRAIALAGELLMVAYLAVLLWLCAELLTVTWQNGVRSQGILRLPMVIPQIGVVLGLGLMLLTHVSAIFMRRAERRELHP